MPSKFSLGDWVEVLPNHPDSESLSGRSGEVVYTEGQKFKYRVKFAGIGTFWFHEKELGQETENDNDTGNQ